MYNLVFPSRQITCYVRKDKDTVENKQNPAVTKYESMKAGKLLNVFGELNHLNSSVA